MSKTRHVVTGYSKPQQMSVLETVFWLFAIIITAGLALPAYISRQRQLRRNRVYYDTRVTIPGDTSNRKSDFQS